MTIMNLLTIIGVATLISSLLGLFSIDRNNKKKHGILGEHEDSITSGYISEYMRHDGGVGVVGTMNNQIVYKVDGDFNGNIKGDNVTVILMGDGNINGNIESNDGNVVLIKGNINGNVKANKVLCPTEPKTGSNSSDCFKCAWLDENGTCKSWGVNEGKCEYVGKTQFETLWSCHIPQGTSPQMRTDHYTPIGNHVTIYGSSPVAHITCPHCRKHFATQLRVRTSVVDGDVVETSVEEMKHDY